MDEPIGFCRATTYAKRMAKHRRPPFIKVLVYGACRSQVREQIVGLMPPPSPLYYTILHRSKWYLHRTLKKRISTSIQLLVC